MTALIALSGGVYGITGNYQADSTPYVGVVVLYSDSARNNAIGYCSGVLISPSAMLTSGHGALGVAAVSVCFDKGPITCSIQDGKIDYQSTERIYTGIPVTYPEYEDSIKAGGVNQGSNLFSSSDLGLIVLDTPVDGIDKFPELPPAGLADTLAAKTNLKEIGYGVQFQVTPRNDGIQNSWAGTLSCNSANTQLIPSNFAGSDKYLRLTANPSQGKGGVAFGDSGGPVLFSANNGEKPTLLAINTYVVSLNCAGVTYHTRIDTTQILAWINGYL